MLLCLCTCARNRLYLQDAALLEETILLFQHTHLPHILFHFQEFDKEYHEVLSEADYTELIRRWNLFRFKLTESLRRAHNADEAIGLLASAEGDSQR